MENKLTIEHLAPYLPYGLEMVTNGDKNQQIWILGHENIKHALTWWKPLLIPLSELTQDHVKDTGYGSLNSLEQDIINKDISVELWLDLIKNHWDVHSLIDQGLALNKLNFK